MRACEQTQFADLLRVLISVVPGSNAAPTMSNDQSLPGHVIICCAACTDGACVLTLAFPVASMTA